MSGIPFPKSRSGWFAATVLIIIVFCWYYGCAYEKLDRYYQGLFSKPNTGEIDEWAVNAIIPLYGSSSTPGWIYGNITNNQETERKATISIEFTSEDIILIPSMYHVGDDQSGIFLRSFSTTVPSKGTVDWRLRFGGSNNVSPNCQTIVKLNGKVVDFHEGISCPTQANLSAIRRSIIENLFLPPWSNTIIPFVVLFICFLWERPQDVDEKGELPRLSSLRILLSALRIFFLSFFSVIALIGTLGILILWHLSWILIVTGILMDFVICFATNWYSKRTNPKDQSFKPVDIN
jgi:hypothetical protein